MINYNLQFFAEENIEEDQINNPNEELGNEDIKAFADIISEKDKKLEELEHKINALTKSNAELLIKVSSGNSSNDVDIEEAILGLNVRKR